LYCADDIISTLVELHHKTLEVFELKEGYYVSSTGLQAVLSQCKQLRRFCVVDPYSHKSNVSMAFEDISKGEWACMELTELALILNRCPIDGGVWSDLEDEESDSDDEKSEEQKEEEAAQANLIATAAKGIYAQIGRLKKLEVLTLDIDISRDTGAKKGDYAGDLTLARGKGWL
ncbi:hypothetical protein BGZ68_004543, partial [Mortierella alpina]